MPPSRTGTRHRSPRPAALAALGTALVAATVLTGGAGGSAAATGPAATGPLDLAAAQRVDNPYAGARVYVNPEWSARAASVPGGEAVADQPTAVWLDRIAAIGGSGGRMGLREHLDAALAQGAGVVQLVLHDLPLRDCDRISPYGELGPDDLPRYRESFVDPIADILADPAYADLRIVTVVEPNSLSRLVTHVEPRAIATRACEQARDTGVYVEGIGYALATLGALPNVYPYLDLSHHGWLGWDEDFHAAARLLRDAATSAGSTTAAVHGFVSNVADYSVLDEPYLDAGDVVAGVPVHQSRWVDWNPYLDELPYVAAFRAELTGLGFDADIGMLIDTSRNGWGGPNRPTGPGSAVNVDEYVNQSRTDRRIVAANWCNQAGSGLGERPTAAPAPGVDAYVWAKPPGESDGSPLEGQSGLRGEPMCDPEYLGMGANPPRTGALPDAPPAGAWFPAHFAELLSNAWPPLE
ncbi:glycoside hydrolase family 6 protein [Streptomyces hoynatensis]|uniref:Glucanase n=1 Tax=Streptomyces hoynatensis TaxID=1141874 RepID=A0A3A9YSB4_9ACTN|nr:glycoside hydrolase family 6 protein [Streptomyces hoynatensis]RKN38136.1 cellobiohydrolase [Streptomyces hoynatensis]